MISKRAAHSPGERTPGGLAKACPASGLKTGLWKWLWLGLLAGMTACQRTEVTPVNESKPKKSAVAKAEVSRTPEAKGGMVMSKPEPVPASLKAKEAPSAAKPATAKAAATKTSAAKTASMKASQPFSTNPQYDEELKKIIDLARRNQWEEADNRISALYALDAKDPSVNRVYQWIKTEGPKHREKELEDKIRGVVSRDTRFNPTVGSILSEPKFLGLPPRSDLREAIEKLNATPYIPENFGKTIQAKGTMEDFKAAPGRMAAILDRQISVHLDNVTLESLIFNVGQAEGINFIADKSIPAFQQKISVNMKQGKLRELLAYISRNMGVQFQVGGDLIWIVDAKDTSKILNETRFYQLRKGLILPAQFGLADITKTSVTVDKTTTITETQQFENFVRDGTPREPAIATAIKNFFTGSIYHIDYERNLIVAQGTAAQLEELEKLIEYMDQPVQQVLIEARFITVTEAMFLQLGIAWETGRNPFSTGRTAKDRTDLSEGAVSLGLEETWTGVLSRPSLSATLTAIEQAGESETLSAPRVTLMNNLPANISDGKIQYYYEEYTVTQTILERRSTSSLAPQGKPTKVTSGVTLDVLASIGGDGKSILLALRPKVSQDVQLVTFATVADRDDQGRLASSFDIKLPEAREQKLSTRVVVKSGQTVAMGGVIQREQKTFVESVPVLSRIPILGAAFRRRTELDRPRFLLVFVTATLLSENGEYIISPEAE